MKITERQGEILNRIVADYIELAQPVSSEFLEKKHNFGICPATIRIEMQKLTDKGFLYQPHTSAGRVPTDKGYRFFVDNLLHAKSATLAFGSVPLNAPMRILLEKEISEFEKILKEEDIFKWASRLTKFLAEESSNFATLHLLDKDFLWKEGWEEIFKEPEFTEKDSISDFAKLLENFETGIKNLKINSGIKIYIGKENPFSKTKDFSIISSKCCFPDDEEGIISLLGPKRMAYDRNISLMNSLTKLLEEF